MQKFLALVLVPFLFTLCFGQASKQPRTPESSTSPERALKLAENGRCKEAIPLLRKSLTATVDKELKRKIGFTGVRCAMTTNRPDEASDFLVLLQREFPDDPDVLYVAVHTYSDLSTQAGERLAKIAPDSYQARELSAEALELQGKWDDAAKEYQHVLAQDPKLPGIHFRIGRLLLSKPNPSPTATDDAKKEFEQELAIDPTNPGAEFILGELARQRSDWPDAIHRFSRAIKLDSNFGDAYLGLGASLVASKKYVDAIAPLETAVQLEPGNPTAHYSLATAYSRAGRKQEADHEFAIHQRLTQAPATQAGPADQK